MKKLKLVKVNFINSIRMESAFFTNNWTNVFSTLLFSIVAVLTVDLIFSRIDTLGGISRDEILFISIFGQFTFYTSIFFMLTPLVEMVKAIREGSLDIWLTRPVPIRLFWISHFISPIAALRDSIPSLLTFLVAINWSNINLNGVDLILGIVMFIIGMIIQFYLMIILVSIAFWQNESTETLNLTWLMTTESMPFDSVPKVYQLFALGVAPQIGSSILAGSIALGILNPTGWFAAMSFSVVAMGLLSNKIWNQGLKNYSSASS